MTTTATVKSPIEVDAALRPALIDLLYRLGDDSLIIGHRNSEWTGIGPILEEDIAFSSMAQDKMGHALAFYTLLHELGEPDPDRIAYTRTPQQYRCCSLVTLDIYPKGQAAATNPLSNNPVRDRVVSQGDWAISFVRQFFFSEADAVRMASLEHSTYEPLAHLARKLRGEIKYHTLHGRTLLPRLGRATPESHDRLQAAVDTLYAHALGMFEPTSYDAPLSRQGITATEAELCDQWRHEVTPIMEQAGLIVPTATAPVYGGRSGKHTPELSELLDAMQKVYRLDPGATW